MNDQQSQHPLADVQTIVVDADDVVETMKRNWRDEDEQRSHVLRVTPPFDGECCANTHVSEDHNYYPPEVDPKPVYLTPAAFIACHSAGTRHPNFPNHLRHPSHHEQRRLFYEEHDLLDDDGGRPSELSDKKEEKWNEWWETVRNEWESGIRHALENTDQLTLTGQNPNVSETTVDVRVGTNE